MATSGTKLRHASVELVFAHIKEPKCARQFLLRCLAEVHSHRLVTCPDHDVSNLFIAGVWLAPARRRCGAGLTARVPTDVTKWVLHEARRSLDWGFRWVLVAGRQ